MSATLPTLPMPEVPVVLYDITLHHGGQAEELIHWLAHNLRIARILDENGDP